MAVFFQATNLAQSQLTKRSRRKLLGNPLQNIKVQPILKFRQEMIYEKLL